MENQGSEWFSQEGIDQSLVSDKIRGFTNSDGSLNTNELLKSYDAAQRMIGGSIRIPAEDAAAEEKAAFWSKLGRPESADKYEWQPPAQVNVDGVTAHHFNEFKAKAFELGISNKQLNGIMAGWTDVVNQLTAERTKALSDIFENSKKTLSAPNEWGDKYQAKYDAVMKMVDNLGIRADLEAAGVLNSVNVLKAFSSIVDGGRETPFRGGSGGADSAARIGELKKSPAYLNSSHPDHDAVVRELNSLLDGNARG